jgi:hypothetical protein
VIIDLIQQMRFKHLNSLNIMFHHCFIFWCFHSKTNFSFTKYQDTSSRPKLVEKLEILLRNISGSLLNLSISTLKISAPNIVWTIPTSWSYLKPNSMIKFTQFLTSGLSDWTDKIITDQMSMAQMLQISECILSWQE